MSKQGKERHKASNQFKTKKDIKLLLTSLKQKHKASNQFKTKKVIKLLTSLRQRHQVSTQFKTKKDIKLLTVLGINISCSGLSVEVMPL